MLYAPLDYKLPPVELLKKSKDERNVVSVVELDRKKAPICV